MDTFDPDWAATDLTDLAQRRPGREMVGHGSKRFFRHRHKLPDKNRGESLSFLVPHPKHCCYGEEYCQFCLENNKNDNCTNENVAILTIMVTVIGHENNDDIF